MKLLLCSLIVSAGLRCFSQDTSSYILRFPSDGFSLSKTQSKSLDSLMDVLDDALNVSAYYIQGHADNTGDRMYNFQLSEKRCQSLKKYLIKKGVSENRITFDKFGADVPVATNETESGKADNRRTVLTVVTKFPAPNWGIPSQSFNVNARGQTIITTKNGCVITVPGDAFELPAFVSSGGKIELVVKEYNNPAYFIASGIPMSYEASGKLFMYHSEEMLSIKAFYNSELIHLKDSMKLTLNCRKVDSLTNTGFYKFDLEEKKWFEDDKPKQVMRVEVEKKPDEKSKHRISEKEKKFDEVAKSKTSTDDSKVSQGLVDEKKSPDKTPEENYDEDKKDKPLVLGAVQEDPGKISTLKIDTGWIAKVRVDTGGVARQKPEEKKEVNDSIPLFCSTHCCLASYYISLGHKLSKKPIDLSGLNLSYNYLSRVSAETSHLNLQLVQTEKEMGRKKYFHVKLETQKLFLRKKAIVKFKYDRSKNPELKALRKIKWIYRFKDNTENYDSLQARVFNDVRISYDAELKTARVKLEENDKTREIILKTKDPKGRVVNDIIKYQKILTPRVMSIYSCFWAYNAKFFATREKRLSFVNWVTYFNSHLAEIHARYDSLDKNREKVIAGLNCVCSTPPDIPCVDCPPCDSCPSKTKELLRPSGPNRILIIGLGLYNFDLVIPIEDAVYFDDPVFKNKRGRKIHPKESFLIISGIKGVIKQDKRLLLISNRKNTLFIVDKSNRRYKIVVKSSENLQEHSGTFIMEDITEKTNTLDGLEKEIWPE